MKGARTIMRVIRTAAFVCMTAAAVALSACSGGASRPAPAATCSPSGTRLSLAAQSVAYATDCLAAPAHRAFTVTFHNGDNGIPHNVSILDASGHALYRGRIISGVKTIVYRVHALAPGRYLFHCDVHPDQMSGTFVVR